MRHLFLIILSFLIVLVSIAQEDIRPIKYGTDIKEIYCDSVFSRFSTVLNLNLENYEVISIFKFVNYSNSFKSSKISYKYTRYVVNYPLLTNHTLEMYSMNFNYGSSQKNEKKFLMCYRTLVPDKDGNYQVEFYIIN